MTKKLLNVAWCVALCFAGCHYEPTSRTAAPIAPQMDLQINNKEPEGLDSAVKVALDWWQRRGVGFPEFQISPPGEKWKLFEDRYAKNPQALTYVAVTKDGSENWWATTYRNRPKYWEISMPTHADCAVVYDIVVDAPLGQPSLSRVHFIFPVSL